MSLNEKTQDIYQIFQNRKKNFHLQKNIHLTSPNFFQGTFWRRPRNVTFEGVISGPVRCPGDVNVPAVDTVVTGVPRREKLKGERFGGNLFRNFYCFGGFLLGICYCFLLRQKSWKRS